MKSYITIATTIFFTLCIPFVLIGLGQTKTNSKKEQVLINQYKQTGKLDTIDLLMFDGPFEDTQWMTSQKAKLLNKSVYFERKFDGKPKSLTNLRKVARKIFRSFLLEYNIASNFQATVAKGQYDCLTGTVFFAFILERLGYEYTIWETNVHTYLTVEVEGQEVLIESTDRVYGFISDPKMIEKKKAMYLSDSQNANKNYYDENIYRKLELTGLLGLIYYNRAVKEFQDNNFTDSAESVVKSFCFYASERNEMLYRLLARLKSEDGMPLMYTISN